jgi:hypothetical protein
LIQLAAPQVLPSVQDASAILTCYRNVGSLPQGEPLLSTAELQPLVQALQKTVPGQFLKGWALQNPQPGATESLTDGIEEMERRIMVAGVAADPGELVDILMPPHPSLETMMARLLFALVRMRAMLRNSCQLMFQITTGHRPPVLDDDKIFGFIPTSTRISDGYSVDCQPSGDEMFAEPGDLLLVDYSPFQAKQLCHLEHATTNFSQELGMSQLFKLRGLSTDLDPYPRLPLSGK